jgi:hypothetical protein
MMMLQGTPRLETETVLMLVGFSSVMLVENSVLGVVIQVAVSDSRVEIELLLGCLRTTWHVAP